MSVQDLAEQLWMKESGSCPDQQRTRIRRGSDGCV